jgi:hypothetical protein
MKKTISKINLDSLGFSASFLCAVHCAAMPLLLTALAISPLSFLTRPAFEISIIILSIIIGVSSLLPSYNNHQKIAPIFILLSGFCLISAGHFIVANIYEPVVTPIGAFSVAFSHLLNWKYSKISHLCHSC